MESVKAENMLKVENLSKKYCRNLKRSLWYGVKDLAGEMLLKANGGESLRRDEFWALSDISFELHKGETLGLIGHNGAGKSTLLKLINGLMKPNKGSISVRGRVGALIELGAGFNPILTGRENIYVNAAVLGMSKAEIEPRFEEIIDFAEIGDFIDAPVQSYSSGMRVRLGFAIASTLTPDILLIDEVLSVGDSSFRERCIERLNNYKRSGGSIIFVSHNSAAVESISDRVMLLDHGAMAVIGEPSEVVEQYERQALEKSRSAMARMGDKNADGDTKAEDIRITNVEFRDMDGKVKTDFEFSESFELRISYKNNNSDINKPGFIFAIYKDSCNSSPVSMGHMLWEDIFIESLPARGVISCIIKEPRFIPGSYRVTIGAQRSTTSTLGKKWYVRPREVGAFGVAKKNFKELYPAIPMQHLTRIPPLLLSYSWSLDGEPLRGIERYEEQG
jgi:lipopolysaccharide transport system ATP-binding protein